MRAGEKNKSINKANMAVNPTNNPNLKTLSISAAMKQKKPRVRMTDVLMMARPEWDMALLRATPDLLAS